MKPKISVIICTYNREKFITASLSHLVNQTLANDQYEIIVINNNCSDNTESIVNKFISNHKDFDIRQVKEVNQGLSFARNRGIKEAKYDVLCYIDDDGNASKNYLELIQEKFSSDKTLAGIGGKVIPVYEDKEPEWYNPFLRMMVTSFDFGDKPFKCYGKKYPAGCSMIYRKELLIKAGGFNNDLKWRADDKYIYHEVKKINDNIYYTPSLSVNHHIDAERTTDANFDRLSGLLGSEERLRVSGINYFILVLEYIFKYFASILIAVFYTLKGQSIKGKYVIRFRKIALQKLLGF